LRLRADFPHLGLARLLDLNAQRAATKKRGGEKAAKRKPR
jgi:hypothetical protein